MGVAEKLLARVEMIERGAFGRYGLPIPLNTAEELGVLENMLTISARVAGELVWLHFLVKSLVARQSLRLRRKDLVGIRQGYD